MTAKRLTLIAGSTFTRVISIKLSNGDPVDITGTTVKFTVKGDLSFGDGSALLTQDITSHIDPSQGQTKIDILAVDTAALLEGVYSRDIKIVYPDGTTSITNKGSMEVFSPVTKR